MSKVGVLLATDAGDGFTRSKYLADAGGRTILSRAVAAARSWPVDELVVVLGPDAELLEATEDLSAVSVLIDPSWSEGLASPMRAVLDLLSREHPVTHVVVGFADQPDVAVPDVVSLVDAASDGSVEAVIPKYRYAPGYPVVLGRGLWDVFLRLEGPIDIHDVLATHARSVQEVWFDHVAPRRILEPDDLPGARR